jgi:hypothetical protein
LQFRIYSKSVIDEKSNKNSIINLNLKKMRTSILIVLLICISALFSFTQFKKSPNLEKKLVIQPGPVDGIDAYIEYYDGENYPNRNWGDYDAFTAIAWTAGEPLIVRSLLKFDFSDLCFKSKIKKATLSLFAVGSKSIGTGHSSMSGPNDFSLMQITSPWDEHEVTWNNQPSVSAENVIHLSATDLESKDYTDIDVTGLVQEMIDNPEKNYGIEIRLNTESYYRRVIFGSSDNANPEKRPKLVIEF